MTVTVIGLSSGAGRLAAMRCILVLAAALALPAQAATSLPCEGRPTGYGTAELVCVLEPGDAAGPLRFSARFSGVHDDSQAGLAASVDGAPLVCTEGSQTRIAGDEGGDTLVCRLVLAAQGQAVRRIGIHLLWFHAEPVAFDLVREEPLGTVAPNVLAP
jgi:hypothetical protein